METARKDTLRVEENPPDKRCNDLTVRRKRVYEYGTGRNSNGQ